MHGPLTVISIHAGKSFSEALIFALTNPQYDDRLFMGLITSLAHENCKLRTCCVHKLFFGFFLTFRTIYVGTQHVLSMF